MYNNKLNKKFFAGRFKTYPASGKEKRPGMPAVIIVVIRLYFAWVNCPFVTQCTTSSERGFTAGFRNPTRLPFSSIRYF